MAVTIDDIKVVEEHYKFPFTLHNYQYESVVAAVNVGLNTLNRAKVGEGKSVMSMYLALYASIEMDINQILITMPPSLLDQWEEFVLSIGGLDTTNVLIFRGTPAERKAMKIADYGVVLVSDRIFVRDFDRFVSLGKTNKLFIIGDELSLKSSSQTYKCWKNLIYRRLRVTPGVHRPFHNFCALNATPVSSRDQVYWWCSLFDPKLYPSQKLFKRLHVEKEDNWGAALSYMNTDLMDSNFDSFSIIPKNTNLELPEEVHIKFPYSLTKEHKKLYEAIHEAEFDKFDVSLIGAVDALFSTLQRVVLCPADFGLDIQSPIIDVIDRQLDQMDDDDKVIIYTRHVSVSRMLAEHYSDRAVAVFGSVSKARKKENIRRFKAGEAEIMIANLDSLSKGQNLQVANQTLYAELPFRSDVLTQACGRTARQGQKKDTCFFYYPIAKGTIQTRLCKSLMENDFDIRKFNNKKTLEEYLAVSTALFGQ